MRQRVGIYRVESEQNRTKAWYANISRSSGSVTKIFSDGVHGGTLKAYRAAIAWREAMLLLYPTKPRIELLTFIRRNNSSGTSGVSRWPADGRNVAGAYWAAKWVETPGSSPKSRKFTVARYGERKAKKLAVDARNFAMATLTR